MTKQLKGKRKRRNNDEIRDDILEFLGKADFPCTTGQIAKAMNLN